MDTKTLKHSFVIVAIYISFDLNCMKYTLLGGQCWNQVGGPVSVILHCQGGPC